MWQGIAPRTPPPPVPRPPGQGATAGGPQVPFNPAGTFVQTPAHLPERCLRPQDPSHLSRPQAVRAQGGGQSERLAPGPQEQERGRVQPPAPRERAARSDATDPTPKHQPPSEQNGNGGGELGGRGAEGAVGLAGPAFRPPPQLLGSRAPPEPLSQAARVRGAGGGRAGRGTSVLAPGKPFVWGPEPSSPEVSAPTRNTMPPIVPPTPPGRGKWEGTERPGQRAASFPDTAQLPGQSSAGWGSHRAP